VNVRLNKNLFLGAGLIIWNKNNTGKTVLAINVYRFLQQQKAVLSAETIDCKGFYFFKIIISKAIFMCKKYLAEVLLAGFTMLKTYNFLKA
jgi:hypothetical protein